MEKPAEVLILGIGNLLFQDDGVGIHVVERMKDMPLPEGVEVLDGGASGLLLTFMMEGRKKVVVIDAVQGNQPPGTLYRLEDKDIHQLPKYYFSMHEIKLSEALRELEMIGAKPEIVLIGIEPKVVEEGLGLSKEVEARIPNIIEWVLHEVGCRVFPHEECGERLQVNEGI